MSAIPDIVQLRLASDTLGSPLGFILFKWAPSVTYTYLARGEMKYNNKHTGYHVATKTLNAANMFNSWA